MVSKSFTTHSFQVSTGLRSISISTPSLVEVEVTEGVTTIGRCAFYGLKKVTVVTIADTVTAIGDYGFYMCKALTEIALPEGVTIGKDAFVKTGSLYKFSIY